ncbi:LOW QUALITY PROTEIN: zf-RVT domain-containing protein, partial [Cephalotus follicularis]
ILRMTLFRQDALPVKYLGFSLITSRLTKRDCAPLMEKFLARANSWTSKYLSYAGRLQLIKSTLASMQVFWCTTFSLPAAVIKECEKVMRRFLWGGNGSSHKHSLVKWSIVCLPREGGLGIKSLKSRNKVLLLKKIWDLLNDHSLWVRWSSGSLSWSWGQILHLRSLALNHLVYVCGKGDRFSLWFDPWFHGSSIYALYGHRVIYDKGMTNSGLAVIMNDQWCWPTTSPDLLQIQHRFQDTPVTTSSDCIFWESVGQTFLTKRAWDSIRTLAPSIEWAKLVWHPAGISKHAFCLWLAILGPHRTLDKLSLLGIAPSACCVFNCGDNENEDHLFFAC